MAALIAPVHPTRAAPLAERAASAQPPSDAPSKDTEPAAFEFTRRKRWADLLISELNDNIVLVLSASAHVWYCGNAVTDLLGWRDDELVDGDLVELMNDDDRATFRLAYEESIRDRTDMLVYTRLQCKNEFFVASDFSSAPREVLFEIRGRPHYAPDTDVFKCYFAMAQPYPSRNSAMLNTVLELKMDTERLRMRMKVLQKESHALDAGRTAGVIRTRDDLESDATASGSEHPPEEEVCLPRKKSRVSQLKKSNSDQHVCVTCGRTDSPEWRKGPMGPKTLCNACGLRWAKKSRKRSPTHADSTDGDSSHVAF